MKTNTRTWKTIAILGHFFGTGIVEAKFPDEIEKLVTGPYSGALQTWVISYPFRSAVLPHYMESFI